MSWEKEREFISLKDMVLRILDEYPAARNNDNILAMKVYHVYYDVWSIFELQRPNIPQFASIRRLRQEIQAKGLYKRTVKEDLDE